MDDEGGGEGGGVGGGEEGEVEVSQSLVTSFTAATTPTYVKDCNTSSFLCMISCLRRK